MSEITAKRAVIPKAVYEERQAVLIEEEALTREQELLETLSAVSPEERERILQRYPSIRPLAEKALEPIPEPEAPVEVVQEKIEKKEYPIKPLSPSDKSILRAIRGQEQPLPQAMKDKITKLKDIPLEKQYESIKFLFGEDVAKGWGKHRKVEGTEEEKKVLDESIAKAERLPLPKLTEEPLKIASEKVDSGLRLDMTKCYDSVTYHRDAAQNIVPETEKRCYTATRNIPKFTLDCMRKIWDDNKVTRRYLDKETQTVVTEEVTETDKKLLGVFLCTPEQGFNASILAFITDLDRDRVKAVLEDLEKRKTEVAVPTSKGVMKVQKTVIASPSECMTILPETGAPKHICGRQLFGEIRYVMSPYVREKLTGVLPGELIGKLEKWWEREPIKL